jgi:hypothetical protein
MVILIRFSWGFTVLPGERDGHAETGDDSLMQTSFIRRYYIVGTVLLNNLRINPYFLFSSAPS